MSFLLKKSTSNYDSAKFLKDKRKECPSIIHSYYYSSFQIVLHILNNIKNKSNRDLYSLVEQEKKSFHDVCINLIFKELKIKAENGKIDNNDVLIFYREIQKLKKLRNDADYSDSDVNRTNLDNSMLYSYNINSTLKNIYGLKL